MKSIFLLGLILSTSLLCAAQPTIFWSEDFNQSASSCNPTSAPFYWTVSELGAQGSAANYWYIDTTVNCHHYDTCYAKDTSTINRALYISYGDTCDSALYGPVYKKGCDNTTNKRVESPAIDCSGKSNITLEFDYMARKLLAYDYAKLWYSANGGSTWDSLSLVLNSGFCPTYGQLGGYWKHYSVVLPSSANNNPDVKIGFRWQNNDDCLGTFVSIAVDNITLSSECAAIFTVSNDSICPGSCAVFSCTSLAFDSLQWYFPGGVPSISDSVSPTVCYNHPGQDTVSLVIYNGSCSDSVTLNNYIVVFDYPDPQGISQNCDTLFANQGAASYQWYYDGLIISGATDYYYVATENGDYNVVATDSNGCEVEAVIFDVYVQPSIISIWENSHNRYKIYLDPLVGSSYLWYKDGISTGDTLSMYYTTTPHSGTYFLKVTFSSPPGCILDSNEIIIP